MYIGALIGTAVIVWQITGDGEATVFEGTALVAAFVILATVAAFETVSTQARRLRRWDPACAAGVVELCAAAI